MDIKIDSNKSTARSRGGIYLSSFNSVVRPKEPNTTGRRLKSKKVLRSFKDIHTNEDTDELFMA